MADLITAYLLVVYLAVIYFQADEHSFEEDVSSTQYKAENTLNHTNIKWNQ